MSMVGSCHASPLWGPWRLSCLREERDPNICHRLAWIKRHFVLESSSMDACAMDDVTAVIAHAYVAPAVVPLMRFLHGLQLYELS